MTISRLAVLLVVMAAGLSGIYLLPKQLGFQPLGINPELPETMGEWWGHDVAVQEQERTTLGLDTEFSRKEYTNGRGDHVLASIVLAGQDMMTAIHRPERCLHAQGWEFRPGGESVIPIPSAGALPVTRLHNYRMREGPDGKPIPVENLCYYWFVCSRDLTAKHHERVWIDSRDRLFGGYAQRWAMIMISADITKGRTRFGRDERQTAELLHSFVAQLAPRLHLASVKYH